MATQYTNILKLALPVQGELTGTWGDTVNDQLTSMVEEAIAGRATISSWASNSHTLTVIEGASSESRAAILNITDPSTSLTGTGTVVCPTQSKVYIVENNTVRTITVKTSAGTGINIPSGLVGLVFCDGTNVKSAVAPVLDNASTVVPQTGGGALTALRTNELRDGNTGYTLPLANSVSVNQTITITLPDEFKTNEPVVTRAGSDTISYSGGTDTSITIDSGSSVSITLTSDGVSDWGL